MSSPARFGNVMVSIACLANIVLGVFSWFYAADTRDAIGVFSMGLPLITAVLTLVAWIATLNPHRQSRPVWAIGVLFFTWTIGAALSLLYFNEIDDVVMHFVAAACVVVIPSAIVFAEWSVANAMASLGNKMQAAGNPQSASKALAVALALRPANQRTRSLLALMLAKGGKSKQAQPMLLEIFECEKNRTEDFLQTFYANCQALNDKVMQTVVGEELEKIAPTPKLFDELIELWLAQGKHSIVLERLNSLTQADRDGYLGIIYNLFLESGDLNNCLTVADRMAELEPSPYETVRAMLRELTSRHPDCIGAWERLRDLCVKARDSKPLGGIIEQLLRLDPENKAARRMLIDHLREAEQMVDVVAQINILDKLGQANSVDYFELAYWNLERGEAQKALDILTSKMNSEIMPEAMYLYAKCLLILGRREEALAVAQKSLHMHHHVTVPDINLPAYLTHTDINRELRTLSRRLELELTTSAVSEAQKRLLTDPDNLTLKFEWIGLLCKSEQFAEAVIAYDDLLGRQPELYDQILEHVSEQLQLNNDTRLRHFQIDLLERRQQWDKMLEAYEALAKDSVTEASILRRGYERILQHAPGFASAMGKLLCLAENTAVEPAECLRWVDAFYAAGGTLTFSQSIIVLHLAVKCNDCVRAERICEVLLPGNMQNPELLNLAADVFEKGDHYERAISLRESAVKLEGQSPDTDETLLRLKRKMLAKKVEIVRQQLKSSPNDAALLDAYGDLMHAQGQRNDAIASYQKASHQKTVRTDIYQAKYAYELLLKGPSFHEEARLAFNDVNLSPNMDPEIQENIKALFQQSSRLVTDEGQYEFALDLLKRIFRVDASYANTVSEIDRLEGILRAKRNR